MSSLDSVELHYEDMVTKNKLRKKDLKMSKEIKEKKPKTKTILSIYTYMNWKQFGLAVRIENGIKTTFLWFETHITFEKR